MNSKQKGSRGERQAAAFLKVLGFKDARRTQQYNGVGESDVVCPLSLPELHIEVKRGQDMDVGTKALEEALHQAERDSDGNPFCVLWRPNRKCWRLSYKDADGVSHTVSGGVDIAVTLRRLTGTTPPSE